MRRVYLCGILGEERQRTDKKGENHHSCVFGLSPALTRFIFQRFSDFSTTVDQIALPHVTYTWISLKFSPYILPYMYILKYMQMCCYFVPNYQFNQLKHVQDVKKKFSGELTTSSQFPPSLASNLPTLKDKKLKATFPSTNKK